MPNFTWLFHATPAGRSRPVSVVRTQAETEEAARASLPGLDLDFAAKITTERPLLHVWTDSQNMTMWSLIGTDIAYLYDMAGVNHGA